MLLTSLRPHLLKGCKSQNKYVLFNGVYIRLCIWMLCLPYT